MSDVQTIEKHASDTQFKVMIVDDEPIIRKALMNIIDWQSLNCTIKYEAEDGFEALEMLPSIKPDILISDIKMPEMDGISLVENLRARNLTTKVILLTGYADFEYAKKGIELGVIDFVLKPTTTESIIAAINKATALIMHERQTQDTLIEMESRVREITFQRIENEIRELVEGIKDSTSDLEGAVSLLGDNVEAYYTLVFEMEFPDRPERPKGHNMLTLRNIISLAFKDITFISSTLKPDKSCLLLLFREDEDPNVRLQKLLTICEEIVEISENFLYCAIFIGISLPHKDLSEIALSYREAEASLAHKFYDHTKNTIHMPYPKAPDSIDMFYIHMSIEKIIDCMQNGESEGATEELRNLLSHVRKNEYSISDAKNIAILLYSLISKLLSNYRLSIGAVMGSESDGPYLSILETKTMTSLFDLLSKTISLAVEHMGSSERQHNTVVAIAQKYLMDNFSKDMRLKDIAAYSHVSSSYLSRLYKRVTGDTITEALTRIRMEKAKDMLTQTDKRSNEISMMVGIDDPVYFSQLFKKYTGLNPKDFRRLSRAKD